MSSDKKSFPAHNIIHIDNVTFSSNFDNGNLLMAEKKKHMEYMIWSACDNQATPYQTKHCTWFYFTVTGLPQGSTVKIHVMNQQRNGSLYKFDHRPVFKCESSGMKWNRIRSPCKFNKNDECPLSFEHQVADNGTLHFAFTYPYTYTMVQDDLNQFNNHVNLMDKPDSIFYQRELVTNSPDGLRIDFVTITSVDGASSETEDVLPGLFPDNLGPEAPQRPPVFPEKEVMFISARVHSGEVPAQHTFKGIFDFLMDPNDVRAKEMRRRYVFKMIPILNPDGVYRGHFRCDQYGNNLNRHYLEPDATQHPSIYAVKHLQEYYAQRKNIAMYLDLHAHASKRGCFIYGNVLDSFEQQVQNQLYCKLIALNTAHFDYEGCLFSRDHMQRVDPGDRSSGLTAEGSGRVSTYLSHKLVHSYTLECNYNCSKYQNEVVAMEGNCRGSKINAPSSYATTSERYTPSIWEGVGRACMVAMLDLRGHNPCSRLPLTRVKTLERIRLTVMGEVRQKAEYRNNPAAIARSRRASATGGATSIENNEIPWVSRTDEVFVPKPKVEAIALPKVQQVDSAAPKQKRVQKEKIVARSESLKMKQAAISLPIHIDNTPSNSSHSLQQRAQQKQAQQQQELFKTPQEPATNCTNPNGPNGLKYKRFFNNNSKENSGGKGGTPLSGRRGSSASTRDKLQKAPCPPPEKKSSNVVPPKELKTKIVSIDAISTLPISPTRSSSSTEDNQNIAPSESQQSILAPQIVFQAPSPPNKSDMSLLQEKSKCSPADQINQVPVASENSRVEKMLSSTDSKEFLPESIMQVYKPKSDRVSKIPKSNRGKSASRVSGE